MHKLSYKTLFTILFFLLIGVVILSRFVLPNKKVSAAWWNETWNYRKAISIDNSSGSDLTDFQISISVGTSALIASGKMQTDCDDIRITDINGNLLPYWIEENNPGCNQPTDTKIWVKASSLPTSGATVFLYYGNTTTTNNENGDDVFLEFDDFNNSSTINNWTPESNIVTTYSIAGGTMAAVATGGDYSSAVFGSNYTDIIVNSRFKVNAAQSHGGFIFRGQTTAADNSYQWIIREGSNDNRIQKRLNSGQSFLIGGSVGISLPSTLTANNWYPIEFRLSGTQVDTYFNNQQAINGNFTDTGFPSGKVGILSYDGIENFDYIFVRKYASTDPTPTLQSEELSPAPIAYWKFDEGVGTTTYDSTSNQNNGTISGATWKTEDQCVSGKCLYFDGINNKININNVKISSENTTISFWVRGTRNNGGHQRIISLGSFTGIVFNQYAANYEFYVGGGTASNNFVIGSYLNNWRQITIVTQGSDSIYYIDGKYYGTKAGQGNPNLNNFNIEIGCDGGATFFQGYLDEIKIYPYARTAAQIKLDYNAGKAHASSNKGTSASLGSNKNNGDLSDGLVGYWKMDEGVGTSITDSSGLGYTGIFSGTTIPEWSSGKYGIGVSFNGTNSYINFGNPGLSSLTNSSISFWRKAVNTNAWLLFQGQNGGYYVMATSGSGTFYHANIGSATKIYVDGNIATTPLTDNNWHHYVITGVNLSTWTNLSLSNYPNFHYNGQIDEIRLYNRSLSPSEVSNLYNYAPGPVGYWDFNEASGTIIKDKSGNGKNLTTYNSPIWNQGKIGSALDFNGSTQYARRTSETSFQRVNGQEISVSVWIYPKRLGGQYQDIVANRSGSGLNWLIYQHTTDGSIQFHGSAQNKSTYIPSLNQWTHIEATVDTAGNYKLYANGQIVQSLTGYTFGTSGITELTVGNYASSYEHYLGSIDDIKIYNYARTQKQIIEDMTSGAPATSSKSMVAYYKLDEGYGTTINNSGIGGTALNGVLGNGTSYTPTWVNNGKFSKAINFDGTTNYATLNGNIDSSNLTISVWVNPKTPTTAYGPIFTNVDYTSNKGYFLGFQSTSITSLQFALGQSNISVSGLNIQSGNWYQIIATWDGTTGKIYLNGTLVKQGSITTPAGYDGNTETIGRYAGSYFYNGLIDELKIYNYALTAEEIKQDYNQGSATSFGSTNQTIGGTTTSLEYCIPGDTSYCASPVAEWKMDEGNGTSIVDTSGNNLTSTFTGSPAWTQGKTGQSLSFNGSNNGVTLSGPTTYAHETMSAWVFIDSSSPSGDIVGNCHTNANQYYGFTFYLDGNNLRAKAATNGDTYFFDNVYYDISSLKNKWIYLSMIWDNLGTGTGGCDANVKLFINGQLVDEATHNVSSGSYNCTYSYPYPFSMGGTTQGSLTRPTKVKLDNVKIYNYARTPAQIAYDYNKGGPVGWWKFDECQGNTAHDWSGIGNTGVINIGASGSQNSLGTCQVGTSAAWTNGASGKINSSLNFDGTDDYITFNKAITGAWPQISYATWFKTTSSGYVTVLGDWSSGASFIAQLSGGKFNLYLSTTGTNPGWKTSTSPFVNDGLWHHIIVSYNGSFEILYIDGVQKFQTPATGNLIPNSNYYFKIGANANSSQILGSFFPGQIDDVRIYNYALTSEQVKTLYNGGAVNFN